MAIPTIGAITLEKTETIDIEKTANIIPLPLPTEDSDQTEVFDLLGVIKFIDVRGTFTGANTAAIKTKVDALEALVDGNQSTVSFISDRTVSVMIASIKINWVIPGFTAAWSVKLIQGA